MELPKTLRKLIAGFQETRRDCWSFRIAKDEVGDLKWSRDCKVYLIHQYLNVFKKGKTYDALFFLLATGYDCGNGCRDFWQTFLAKHLTGS